MLIAGRSNKIFRIMGNRSIARQCAWLVITLLGWNCWLADSMKGQVLSPHKALGRYQQYVWQDQHGLPQNSANAITRTRDGYLWVGTFEGAARFDGVRFTVFDSSNTPALRASHQVTALCEDRAGNLWLGTNGGGVIRYRDGHFQAFATAEGLASVNVRALLEDRAGNLWISTDKGLHRWHDGRFTVFDVKNGLPHEQVWGLTEDRDGNLWAGTGAGVVRFANGQFTVYAAKEGLPPFPVYALLADRAGRLWVGSNGGGLYQLIGNRLVARATYSTGNRIRALYEDRDGGIWVGTQSGGLSLIEGNHVTPYSTREGFPGDSAIAFYQDPEGDLWVGTRDVGLCQLRAGRFRVYSTQDGLPHNNIAAIFADSLGRVWVGTSGGIGRWQDGVITGFTARDGLNGGTITEDSAGNIWASAQRKLLRYRDGRFTPFPMQNGPPANSSVSELLGDRAGNLWIGLFGDGLRLYRDGRFTTYTMANGLVDNYVINLYEDRAGGIWIGTLNGMSRWQNGRFTNWTTDDGLSSNRPLSFYEDRQGSMWIGTSGGGLNRFKEGKFVAITRNDGLYDNLAFQILSDTEDDSGSLWMSSNRGIYRASLRELNDFADGRIHTVNSYDYGVSDGMLSRECNEGGPGGCKTRDGRLWFSTVRGVVVVDPRVNESAAPRVAIEAASIDKQPVATELFQTAITLDPNQENLEIQYTAFNWSRPQHVRFKYQLSGFNHDWVEAGGRRTAYYSHLPPGNYVFKVIADNGEGVWNTAGQSLRIRVLPPFYRTWWFVTLALLALFGAVFGGFRYRVNQLEQRQAAQQAFAQQLIESQEAERKRIAAELHDSLGQQLLVIKNWAMIGLGLNENGNREPLDQISATASQAIDEVRQVIYDLRPYQLDKIGLSNTLRFMIEKVATASGIAFTVEIGEIDDLFSHNAQVVLYRIVQEGINNIVKHSRATAARIALARAGQRLSVVIEDNGRGFGHSPAEISLPPAAGLGLTSLRERVQMLGGQATIHSEFGSGTKIEIMIALDRPQS